MTANCRLKNKEGGRKGALITRSVNFLTDLGKTGDGGFSSFLFRRKNLGVTLDGGKMGFLSLSLALIFGKLGLFVRHFNFSDLLREATFEIEWREGEEASRVSNASCGDSW